MTHYRLADSTPSAIILARNPRTSSLDELKTYQGNDIFLNNGDEFQIRLFNPLSEKIGAQVSINGKTPNRLLVLNPGEVVDVDRFIDEQRRMIFETYQYDDGNSAAKSAVANNGIVQINFHKEFVPVQWPVYNNTVTTTFPFSGGSNTYATLHNTGGMGTVGLAGSAGTYGNSSTLTSNCFHLSADITLDMNANITSDNNIVSTPNSSFSAPGVYCMDRDLSFVSDNQPQYKSKSPTSRKLSKSMLKETGRVEKGEKSDQRFKSVDIQFETYAFHTIIYHLKPMSEKNSYIKEVREYCTTCGYRLRNDKWMFCPKCGERL